jgi:hypothetical protein
MVETSYSEFVSHYNAGDISRANMALSRELGRLLVTNRQDFIDLLNESGVYANSQMPDERLMDLFFDNVGKNKHLQLGASLLVSINNKEQNFDGSYETNDDATKAAYHTLKEEYSGIIPLLIGAATTVGGSLLNRRNDKLKAQEEKKQKAIDAKNAMALEVQRQKGLKAQAQIAAQQSAAAKEKSKTYIKIAVIGGIVLVGTVLAYMYFKKK